MNAAKGIAAAKICIYWRCLYIHERGDALKRPSDAQAAALIRYADDDDDGGVAAARARTPEIVSHFYDSARTQSLLQMKRVSLIVCGAAFNVSDFVRGVRLFKNYIILGPMRAPNRTPFEVSSFKRLSRIWFLVYMKCENCVCATTG